ncbi:hypothetical protein M422DRAFT_25994 [Sphaerobolus stellatus SS14]|nr:hypothetical protein M422DRAFT_25994 [Sphaerobolus stellatus SS14]
MPKDSQEPTEETTTSPMMHRALLGPSPSYLAIAQSTSIRASSPTPKTRKLLILDLNGTLLLRPKPRNAKSRPVHPRPFMPTFGKFLFHEDVKRWLDTMVWSSAMPHSVDAMVDKCFMGLKGELKAIWGRDTLGLATEDYSRKVQTIKNLELPWSQLAALPSHDASATHTAETTLLLDDSTAKAQLQPYNHLCIPEYTKNQRNLDLKYLEIEKGDAIPHERSPKGYDPTLIAVMGVLDEIKRQSNVAGWMRAGGLWAGHRPPPRRQSIHLFSDDELAAAKDKLPDTSVTKLETEADNGTGTPSNPGNDAVIGQDELMWFDHEPAFMYWVEKGYEVIKEMGLELDHGMEMH